MKFVFAICVFLALASAPAAAQTVLGKHPKDKVLPEFWGQNTNAPITIQGLNTYAGTNRFAPALIGSGAPTEGQVPVYRSGALVYEDQSGSGSGSGGNTFDSTSPSLTFDSN